MIPTRSASDKKSAGRRPRPSEGNAAAGAFSQEENNGRGNPVIPAKKSARNAQTANRAEARPANGRPANPGTPRSAEPTRIDRARNANRGPGSGSNAPRGAGANRGGNAGSPANRGRSTRPDRKPSDLRQVRGSSSLRASAAPSDSANRGTSPLRAGMPAGGPVRGNRGAGRGRDAGTAAPTPRMARLYEQIYGSPRASAQRSVRSGERPNRPGGSAPRPDRPQAAGPRPARSGGNPGSGRTRGNSAPPKPASRRPR